MTGSLDTITQQAMRPALSSNDLLAALDEAAQERVDSQRPRNTIDAYADDFKVWRGFCAEYGLDAYTVSQGMLVGFVEWLDHGKQSAPATMTRRVTGAVVTLRGLLGAAAVPVGISRLASNRITQITARLGNAHERRGRGEAVLITPDELRAMCYAQDTETLIGLRNRTMLLTWGYLGTRVSEIAGIRVEDISEDDGMLRVHIPWSKTGEKNPVIDAKPGSDLCPLTSWYRWRDTAELPPSSPAFPRMDRWGKVYATQLTCKAIEKAIAQAARKAGLDIHVTGHSLRAFMATESRRGGASIEHIADQGGWNPRSESLWRYIRRVDERGHNATSTYEI